MPSRPAALADPISTVSLDLQALVELRDADECQQTACLADRLQSQGQTVAISESSRDRALAVIDEQLLKLFHGAALRRSHVKGLFWQDGLLITDD